MYWPNLKSVAFSVPEIIGGSGENWAVPGYAHAPFSPKILMGFCSDGTSEVLAKFGLHSFTRSRDNSDWSFGWGLRTPNLGEGEAVGGRGWYRSKDRR